MRILCVLIILLTGPSLVFLSIDRLYIMEGILQEYRRQSGRIASHIADQTLAASAQIDSLIELLCDLHRLLCAESQFGARFLLQRRSDERHFRLPLFHLFLNIGDDERSILAAGDDRIGLLFVLQLRLFSIYLEQTGRKAGPVLATVGIQRPVFLFFEVADLVFPLDDQP